MSHRIRIRKATLLDVEEFVSTSQAEGLPSRVCDPIHIAWKHLESPDTSSTAVDLVKNEDVVGRLWVSRRQWLVDGIQVSMGHPQDLLILKGGRSLREIADLINAAFNTALSGSGIMYHGSNENSDGIYRRMYRTKESFFLQASVIAIAPFSLLFRQKGWFLNTNRIFLDEVIRRFFNWLESILKGDLTLRTLEESRELSKIIEEFRLVEPCAAIRSEEFFNWRFKMDPSSDYVVRVIQIKNQEVGYVVWTDVIAFGVKARVVVDIVWIKSLTRINKVKFWLTVVAFNNLEFELLLFISNWENRTLRSIGSFPLIKVPKRFMPQEIPVYLRTDPEVLPKTQIVHQQFQSAYFTLSDLDFF
jgi:hypothetical protein